MEKRLRCFVLRGGEFTKLEIIYKDFVLETVYEDVDREAEIGMHSMKDVVEEYGEYYYKSESHFKATINDSTVPLERFMDWYIENILE